ncbi:MAG: di-heme oxidoredictase family protein, partial [Planctomycetota bacterium]
YISRVTPITRYDYEVSSQTTETFTMLDDTVMGTAYYGGEYSMEPGDSFVADQKSMHSSTVQSKVQTAVRPSVFVGANRYVFQAASVPPMTLRFIDYGRRTEEIRSEEKSDIQAQERQLVGNQVSASGRDTYNVETSVTKSSNIRETITKYARVHMEPTHFTQEWRTPPLWGVRDSAPYWHDGRAETLLEAITLHGGESAGTRDRFLALSLEDRQSIIEFLGTLVAPQMGETPSQN